MENFVEREAETMEAQSENSTTNGINTSWSSTANWEISHGSLHTSITVESSDFPVDSVTVDSTSKSPLVLRPSSSDSGPCEIKISLKQRHEIQQVYVRSTARVYEIYYTPDLRSNNEYLCTVRCGIAERDEELLRTTYTEETVDTDSKGRSTNGSNNGSSEDDWVEVKIPHSPVIDNGNSSFPKKHSAITSNIQDFYEATAEISDSDPCISLTLRLLSLQNKERVFVDEIYIFADPVDSSDSENQGVVQAVNSSGSSLMAMLAPTLLQLSKSGISRLQENQPSTIEEPKYEESKRPELNNTLNQIQNDGKPDQQDGGERKDDFVAKNDDLCRQFEGILERLETRVSRIEDLFLRFEENMVKPINGIETRLQRVEQQMEELSSSFQNLPVFPSSNRFFAPAFSSMESYSSSYNEGTDLPLEKDSAAHKISKPPANEMPTPATAPEEQEENKNSGSFLNLPVFPSCNRFFAPAFSPMESYSSSYNEGTDLPPEKDSLSNKTSKPPANETSTPVTAPEEQEENENSKSSNDSPMGKQKKSVSIDDALAAAFAGFSSMASVEPPKSTEGNGDDDDEIDTGSVSNTEPFKYKLTLKVTAPEFSMEDSVSDSCVENSLFEEAYEGCTECSSIGTGNEGSSSPQAKRSLKEDDQQIIEELVPKRDAFMVDFETPILNVAFVSRENSSLKSSLEALMGEAEGGVEDEESDSPVVIGDGGIRENQFLVDLEGYSVGEVEVEEGDDKVTGDNKQEVFESLI